MYRRGCPHYNAIYIYTHTQLTKGYNNMHDVQNCASFPNIGVRVCSTESQRQYPADIMFLCRIFLFLSLYESCLAAGILHFPIQYQEVKMMVWMLVKIPMRDLAGKKPSQATTETKTKKKKEKLLRLKIIRCWRRRPQPVRMQNLITSEKECVQLLKRTTIVRLHVCVLLHQKGQECLRMLIKK